MSPLVTSPFGAEGGWKSISASLIYRAIGAEQRDDFALRHPARPLEHKDHVVVDDPMLLIER